MSGPYTQQAWEDPTGVLIWLRRRPARTAPTYYGPSPQRTAEQEWYNMVPVPRTIWDTPTLTIQEEWENLSPTPLWGRPSVNPKAKEPAPVRRTKCLECGGPMPAISTPKRLYCSRGCKSISNHRTERMVVVTDDGAKMLDR